MKTTLLILSIAFAAIFATGVVAQSRIKTHKVSVSKLQGNPNAEGKSANKDSSATQAEQEEQEELKREARTKAETDKIFDSMIEGYRSACCTFQEMRDTSCPCHQHQMMMLRFLIQHGFTRQEVENYMVNGGPKGLRNKYITYLKAEGIGRVEDFMRKRGRDAGGFWKVGDVLGPGYDLGWTEIILEAPEKGGMWVLVFVISLALIAAFGVGFMVLKRGRDASKPAEAAEAKSALSDEMRASIEREARRLEEE